MSCTSLLIGCLFIIGICKGAMDILVIGDWGGSELRPFTTSGELSTAKIMNEVASVTKPSMIWSLGDNFYLKGVRNVDDHRFKDVWSNVFNGPSISSLPFYVVAGNHDHYGNISAQIAYSNISSRWTFPHYWYSQTWNVPNTSYTLQLLMIDTILACGNVMSKEYCALEGIIDDECVLDPLGPENKRVADEQWSWIENELKSSSASFVVVAGHFPIWSVAEHGPTKTLVEQLRPLLIEYNVTLMMAGHDHTFQYIEESMYPNLGYVGAGGSHECNPKTLHEKDIPSGSLKFHDCNNGGFTKVHIDKYGLYVDYYFGNASNSYFTTPTFKPRL
eukprot:243705_1